jgi:hypothetical protein
MSMVSGVKGSGAVPSEGMPRSWHGPPVVELRRDFGIEADMFAACPFGFESECWIADDRWFVKVWLDEGHPVDLALLEQLADHELPVPRPLPPGLARTDDGRRYAVFPYVRGRHATGEDWAEVARMLRRVHDLPTERLGLPTPSLTKAPLHQLRPRLDHPWIAERRDELAMWIDRFEAVTRRAESTTVPAVLSHDDFGGNNILIGDAGHVAAVVDWDWARLGPREHDLWLVIDESHPTEFLHAYGAADLPLDVTHLEYGLLRRALGDLAARVVGEVDRPGVGTWGFDRLARIDNTLRLFH